MAPCITALVVDMEDEVIVDKMSRRLAIASPIASRTRSLKSLSITLVRNIGSTFATCVARHPAFRKNKVIRSRWTERVTQTCTAWGT